MNVKALAASLTPEQVECAIGALNARALLYSIGGRFYAARLDTVWWMWELKHGSQEYAISRDFSTCTCPAEKPCKHVLCLKYGKHDAR